MANTYTNAEAAMVADVTEVNVVEVNVADMAVIVDVMTMRTADAAAKAAVVATRRQNIT